MSASIVLPEGYRYVVASIVPAVWIMTWQMSIVGRYRSKAKIPYPQPYAEKAEAQASRDAHLFNCAQRTHQNTLENLPTIVITTLVSGIKYPIFAASLCGFWMVTRVLYTLGYVTGDASKRNTRGGALGHIPFMGLILGSTYVAYQLLVGA